MPAEFLVAVIDGDLIVSTRGFKAIYYKSACSPHLVLRERSKTDDYELSAAALQAALAKARELGWIV
jgi:hypothetical protein